MNKYNKNIPGGTRDVLYGEVKLYDDTVATLRSIYESDGYAGIMTPTIEYYDTFDYESQSMRQEEMFKLTDTSGRLVVLRPDSTTPTARVLATKLKNASYPQKLYYNQNVFRINQGYSGMRSEVLQSGVELTGVLGLNADLCCLNTAIKALSSLGLDFKIEIGHSAFSDALIGELCLDKEEKLLVKEYVNTKNPALLNFLEKKADLSKIRQLTRLYGEEEVLKSAKKLAGGNAQAADALSYVEKIYSIMKNSGYANNVLIDMGMANAMDYYTGVVFKGYINGAGEAVLLGGRYDNLVKLFDHDIPAVGFAINVCLVVDAIKKKQGCEDACQKIERLIHFAPEDIFLADALQKEYESRGIPSMLSCYQDKEESLEYARRILAKEIACVSKAGVEIEKVEG